MSNTITSLDVRKIAADLGLVHLTDEHLEELLRAINTVRVRRTALRIETLAPADEPAHLFVFGAGMTP